MGFNLRKGRRGPQAICDRTGKKHPYGEMVVEPGTGLFVHFLESDKRFNAVDHPQAQPIEIDMSDGAEGFLRNATGQDRDNTEDSES